MRDSASTSRIDELVGEDRLRMEVRGVAALLDVDRAIVERNATTLPNFSPPMLLKLALRRMSVSWGEAVAMDRRFAVPPACFDERQPGEAGAFVKQVFGGKIAKPEILPPDGLLFATVPIEHEREKPARLLFGRPFGDVVGHAVASAARRARRSSSASRRALSLISAAFGRRPLDRLRRCAMRLGAQHLRASPASAAVEGSRRDCSP